MTAPCGALVPKLRDCLDYFLHGFLSQDIPDDCDRVNRSIRK
jgi:hypothetical protein